MGGVMGRPYGVRFGGALWGGVMGALCLHRTGKVQK